MNRRTSTDWDELLSKIAIKYDGYHLTPSSAEALSLFESTFPFSLPEEYKIFAQRMGGGTFGDSWIGIGVPYEKDLLAGISSDKDLLRIYQEQFEDFPRIVSLLDEGWIFGGRGEVTFIFTKAHLEEKESSPSIYAIADNGSVHNLGQSFFDFVRDYCLGQSLAENFSDLLIHMLPLNKTASQVIVNTFTPG